MTEKVVVIGAGTAGLLTAKRLGELGISTVVYDQKQKPGIPVRASGILSINGLNSLKIDYHRAATNVLYGAKIHAGNETMVIRARKPQAYVLDRLRLNELLSDDCEKLGVQINTSRRVDSETMDSIKSGSILVGADGAVSLVAKHFGFPPIDKHILTYRAEYTTDDPKELDMVELFFNNGVAPGFFGWIAPESSEIVEVGMGVDSGYGNSKLAFDNFLGLEDVAERVEAMKFRSGGASVIPIGLRKRFVDPARRVMLVGDAAGQVKPTTGGGIIFGGNAALIAANTIGMHMRGWVGLEMYEKLWRKEFDREMLLHRMFYRLYSSVSKKNLERATKMLRLFRLDAFFGEYGDMDRPSLMIKRFFLRGFAK